LLDEAEIAELAQDIAANGIKQSITLLDGKILDGRNRYRACLSADVEPRFDHYQGDTPVADVISWNAKRRHLTKAQVAAVLLAALPLLEKEKERIRLANLKQKTEGEIISPSVPKGKATDVLGAQHGVSGRLIRMVKKIKEHSPERFEQLRQGKIQIFEANRLTIQEIQKAEYEARVEEELKSESNAFSECKIIGWGASGLDGPDALLPILKGGPEIRPGWSVLGLDFNDEYIRKRGITGVPKPLIPPPLTAEQKEARTKETILSSFRRQVAEHSRIFKVPEKKVLDWILDYLQSR
jgi:hypothetical protein